MSRPPAQPNQSLLDGITVLQAVAESPEPIGCVKLAEQLGMETTRVNRLLKTLEFAGIIRQNHTRRYSAGSGMHVLAAQSLQASGILQSAAPFLHRLEATGCIVALGVYWRGHISYLYHHHANSPESANRHPAYPAGSSSLGRVLLAAMEPEFLQEEFAGRGIPGYRGTLDDFMAEREIIRRQGYALLHDGHCNLAVALAPETGAAIALSNYNDPAQTAGLLELLRQSAAAINAALAK